MRNNTWRLCIHVVCLKQMACEFTRRAWCCKQCKSAHVSEMSCAVCLPPALPCTQLASTSQCPRVTSQAPKNHFWNARFLSHVHSCRLVAVMSFQLCSLQFLSCASFPASFSSFSSLHGGGGSALLVSWEGDEAGGTGRLQIVSERSCAACMFTKTVSKCIQGSRSTCPLAFVQFHSLLLSFPSYIKLLESFAG